MPPDLSTIKNDAPLEPVTLPTSAKSGAEQRWKYRARFRKAGDLRFVSHHDLMHVIERMFRRADLRLSVTQGFNPRPKITFALSLALGVVGLSEVLEFEAGESLDVADVERRLRSQCPPGLEIVRIRAIDFRQSAQVRRAFYRVACSDETPSLAERCDSFLKQTECWVERKRPQPRRVNVRPFVDELAINENNLQMALWITPNGAARPEEVSAALGLTDWLDAGAVIERTGLELYDELPPDVPRAPAIQSAFAEITTTDNQAPASDRPTAIFDSPMSFET